MAGTCDLVAIRTALLDLFAADAAAIGDPRVVYQGAPQGKPWPITEPVVRAIVTSPTRQVLGEQVERLVQQDGTLVLQWMFPRGTPMVTVTETLEVSSGIFRAQALSSGLQLTGATSIVRVGYEGDRMRWDLIVPWRTVAVESARADESRLAGRLPTTAEAFAAVRSLWLSRIEQAVTADGWAGLQTIYDDAPILAAPPALPWCGYWLDAAASAPVEVQTGTETVLGRALVQLHTDAYLGEAAALQVVERIVAEHARAQAGVTFAPVQVTARTVSPVGTLQTNLRIPFTFERLRPS